MEESRCSAVVELFTKFPPNAENNMGVKLHCIPQREEKKVWIKYHTLCQYLSLGRYIQSGSQYF